MPDFRNCQLGLIHVDERPGAVQLRDMPIFAAQRLSPVNYHQGMQLGDDLGNYKNGCCVEAGMYRLAQMRTHLAQGSGYTPKTAPVLKLYSEITGFDPNNPSTDNGTILNDAWNWWAQKGLDMGLQAPDVSWPHVSVDSTSIEDIVHSIDWFGGTGFSLSLPVLAQSAEVWDVTPAQLNSPEGKPGSWGGHFVPSGRFDGTNFWVITWGIEMMMTPEFVLAYAMAIDTGVSRLWIDPITGKTPSGFTIDLLRAAVTKV